MSVIKSTVHLCIPQLFQPLALWKQDFNFEVEAPFLSQLLRQNNVIEKPTIQGLMASLFDVVGGDSFHQNQELPVAYYRYQIHDKSKPTKTLLCADPIHLEVGMNDITLTEKITDLSEDEAGEMIQALNEHFKQDGLEFIQGSNQHWYVALPQKEKPPATTPLGEVLRKNIAKFQPKSRNKQSPINWKVIQNEAQMILHSSSVNQQREMAGLPTANSLWFWGGGQALTSPNQSDIVSVYSHQNAQTNAKMIAKAAGCEYATLPDKLSTFKAGKTIIILDQLFDPAVHDYLDNFQQALSEIDEQIIKPLSDLWHVGKVDLCIDGCDGRVFQPKKLAAWKLWKNKPVSLAELSPQ
jgi:hypothetical protein